MSYARSPNEVFSTTIGTSICERGVCIGDKFSRFLSPRKIRHNAEMAVNWRDIQKKAVAFRDARDWKQFHNPKDVALSLVLEATEVMEHFQWRNSGEMKKYVRSHKGEIADELADVLYWIAIMSKDLDIDLFKAFEVKMKKNEKKYPVGKAKGKHTKYTNL